MDNLKTITDEFVFAPLGGVGEIGMNMYLYGFGPVHERKWIVVDCGVSFAGPDLPGIDLIMPDIAFLEEEADNVLGLLLTHAHEDHYGAILDLWPGFDKPVFATAFGAGLLKAKRIANRIEEDVDIHIFEPGKPFQVGPFKVEAVSMAHSIPDSCGFYIETPAGRVFHSGDWKIDSTRRSTAGTDIERIKQIGDMGTPLALICDSTNALKEGNSPSEDEVEANLTRIIAEAKGRVAVTVFASNLDRMIAVARAAAKADRQVVAAGRAIHRIVGIARELGLLDDVPEFLDQDSFGYLPRDKVVLICTGSQGEPRAAIARIAAGEHPVIDLAVGDKVLFSSWAIPGNEKAVLEIQNKLAERGVEVITNSDQLIHVSGHPRRNELVQLYSWLKPTTLVPVHGEAMHLLAHAKLGRENGIENVANIRNGDMVKLFPNYRVMKGEIPTGELYLDGNILCTPEESNVRMRRKLGFSGLVVVTMVVNGKGQIISGPLYDLDGLPDITEDDDNLEDAVASATHGTIKSFPEKRRSDVAKLAEAIRRAVRAEVNLIWGRKPVVKVFVHRI